jgi:hypothetical protein
LFIYLHAVKPYDVGPTALLLLRRKACCGLLSRLKSIASAGFEIANLGSEMLKLPIVAVMMEAVNTSETSINFYETTRHNIPGDNHLLEINSP